MYAAERQQLILERARGDGRVDVNGLSSFLDVTPETVRRDLSLLERHGLLRRVHGGAVPVERLGFEPGLAVREDRFVAEKERIAKAAVAELPDDGAILLDAGTTTARLAEQLPFDRELRVVTNSLTIANTVATRSNLTLYLVGGRVRGVTLAGVGEWPVRALAEVFVDVAFLGTNGLSVERGLTTADQTEAGVKHAMANAARRCVVLADHTKIGTDHFARVAAIDVVDTVITDTGLDDETATELEAAGPRVVRA
ncbi:DeoR/GlpR transcriptional regulator [Actinobacteria bacterium YIM 96077]|uniref:Lactose phosphotransferase system repressor n=1 Tax=Phytoactinopolyspora halophila TaxID=1981511 RepID=A0A329QAM2_9ACTN|nr:DeoR/GlpR family DNA-binding transcription regulator [Phytoactinopolyspora halophila]AYY12441.1 DeoR/GlpR transcriptional regulator [Actinobacteria bacterium YIM 96077]RAW09277.1 D-beta-D-heptose 1-phosphate adenosyltransferase [Phytoactinopolyspora halophila]